MKARFIQIMRKKVKLCKKDCKEELKKNIENKQL